jgi:hypothetical protein
MYGLIPLADFYSRERRQLWRLSRARKQSSQRALLMLEGDDVVHGFANAGYRTIGAGGVRWFRSGYLPALFDEFQYWGPAGDDLDKFAPRFSVDFALSHTDALVSRACRSSRYFLFINAAETHALYGIGDGDREVTRAVRRWSTHWNGASLLPRSEEAVRDMEVMRSAQIKALETADMRIGELFSMLPRPAIVIVCGDHGELFGESRLWGHDVAAPEVLTVPMWIGCI